MQWQDLVTSEREVLKDMILEAQMAATSKKWGNLVGKDNKRKYGI